MIELKKIVSQPQNRSTAILSKEKSNVILSALQAEEHRTYINNELDKSLVRENDPNTKWYTSEDIKAMLGL
jgi:hypothetical protein